MPAGNPPGSDRPRHWPLRRTDEGPSRPQRASVAPALTVLRAASAETIATMAVTRLIRDAFCACVSCHQANPIPKDSVVDTKAVTVPATATGCFLVCGHWSAVTAPASAQSAAASVATSVVCADVQCTALKLVMRPITAAVSAASPASTAAIFGGTGGWSGVGPEGAIADEVLVAAMIFLPLRESVGLRARRVRRG